MSDSSKDSSKLTNPIAVTLVEKQEEILKLWVAEVKASVEVARKLKAPIIVNTLPVFIKTLAEAIDGNFEKTNANDSNNIAEAHGSERARITDYSPDHIVLEYTLLRDVILQILKKSYEIDLNLFSIIQKSFDEGIQKSMVAFHQVFNEMRENFINHMTHDMRTPLTAAKLSLDLMLRKIAKPNSPEIKEQIINLIQRVKKNINYSNELIQSILDEQYLKSDMVHNDDRFEAADMMGIVESALEGLSDGNLSQIQVSGEHVHGYWDKKALRRVIENLISNAIKYGTDDTPVKINVCSTIGRCLVSVHNEGNPIPAEDRESLFSHFSRLTAAREGNKEGWGIGLALCKEVAEDHAGSIGIESSLEDGTTFTVDVPIDPRGIESKPQLNNFDVSNINAP